MFTNDYLNCLHVHTFTNDYLNCLHVYMSTNDCINSLHVSMFTNDCLNCLHVFTFTNDCLNCLHAYTNKVNHIFFRGGPGNSKVKIFTMKKTLLKCTANKIFEFPGKTQEYIRVFNINNSVPGRIAFFRKKIFMCPFLLLLFYSWFCNFLPYTFLCFK